MSHKLIEFLLWDNCNNHCKFCFLKENNPCPSFLTYTEKLASIDSVIDFINTRWVKGDGILLCGGELFDYPMTQKVFVHWNKLVDILVSKVKDGSISEIYINTNLIYDINLSLIPFLVKLAVGGILDALHFTTSFDLYGRFKSEKDLNLFVNNVKQIKTMFPDLEIITNIVMTKQFCEAVNSGFDVDSFQKELGITANLIPYIILTDNMAPSKEQVMDTLRIIDSQIPGYLIGMVKRFTTNQDRHLYKFHNNNLEYITAGKLVCGHSENFNRYTDSGSCFICDIINLKEEIYG